MWKVDIFTLDKLLQKRMQTAIIVCVAVVAIISLFPSTLFQIAMCFLAVGVYDEWFFLADTRVRQKVQRELPVFVDLGFCLRIAVLILSVNYTPVVSFAGKYVAFVIGLSCLGFILYLLFRFHKTKVLTVIEHKPKKDDIHIAAHIIGSLLQVSAWNATLILHLSSPWALILVIAATSCADIAGYVVGKRFGTKKIFPRISPGKTLQGTVAMVFAPIVFWMMLGFFGVPFAKEHKFFGFAIGVLALLGDLWVSLIKRWAQVKDSGGLLPGHGGLLDRLDSHIMVLACLCFVFTMQL